MSINPKCYYICQMTRHCNTQSQQWAWRLRKIYWDWTLETWLLIILIIGSSYFICMPLSSCITSISRTMGWPSHSRPSTRMSVLLLLISTSTPFNLPRASSSLKFFVFLLRYSYFDLFLGISSVTKIIEKK